MGCWPLVAFWFLVLVFVWCFGLVLLACVLFPSSCCVSFPFMASALVEKNGETTSKQSHAKLAKQMTVGMDCCSAVSSL